MVAANSKKVRIYKMVESWNNFTVTSKINIVHLADSFFKVNCSKVTDLRCRISRSPVYRWVELVNIRKLSVNMHCHAGAQLYSSQHFAFQRS